MTLSSIQLGLLPFLSLLTTSAVAGWMSPPMSWSPDGEWLSYTVVSEAGQNELHPGWLFLTSNEVAATTGDALPTTRGVAALTPLYRIWATHRDHRPSVLIEESQWPLTAPAWSPRGKAVAFGRFVPQSIEPAAAVQRGRYEVVIQDGLDRKHVVWSSPELGLDPLARSGLPYLRCSWSPDGLYLAVPRPGDQPGVDIVRVDSKQRVRMLDHASLPAWSPDGSKCAFVRRENNTNILVYIERRGQSFGEPHLVATMAPIPAAPSWNTDSRSIFTVVEKPASRSHELEIVRLILDPSESVRVLTLVPEPMRRGAKIRGLAIDFDHEADRCFFAVDLEGRDSDVVWCLPRDRGTIHKRFHPLDVSQRIESLSISPDGQLVAIRFGSPGGLTPPLIYDSETEQSTLLVPDDGARKEWLGVLAGAARRLLTGSLPPPMVDGQVAERPTLLPLTGELPAHENVALRLTRLARFASPLCSLTAERPEPAKRRAARSFEPEARLFFNYLGGDYEAAAADLGNLEPLLSSSRERLSLLGLRAQLCAARGDRVGAKAAIDYLLACGDPNRCLVEETPLGLVFSPATDPRQLWAHYLSARSAAAVEPKAPLDGELPTDVLDPRLRFPPRAPDALIIERPGGPIPFAPFAPVHEIP